MMRRYFKKLSGSDREIEQPTKRRKPQGRVQKTSTAKRGSSRKPVTRKAATEAKPSAKAPKRSTTSTGRKPVRKTSTRAAGKNQAGQKHRIPQREARQLSGLPWLVNSFHHMFDNMRTENTQHNQAQERLVENVTDKLQHTFDELHKEFDERERLLEKKMQRSDQEHEHEIRRVRWMSIPVGIIAVAGLGYIFYVVHVMENAMSSMSADMNKMGNNVSSMSVDTRSMSNHMYTMNENIAKMDQSMGHMNNHVAQMNHNMAYMGNNVAHMNRNMGAMTQTMQPIGEAAQTASPIMGMMRSFMPF